MIVSMYFLLFVIFSVFWIVLKGTKEGEYKIFKRQIVAIPDIIFTLFKGIPALFAIFFIIINPLDNSLSFFFLVGAFVFCFLGDIGMERGLLTGLPLFLIAQLFFILGFTSYALTFTMTGYFVLLTFLIFLGMLVYVYFLLRYLNSSEKGLGSFKKPVIIYATFLGLMLTSTFLLWLSVSKLELAIVVLGALLFVISDSMIAVREFHHYFPKAYTFVMSTYYSAILLMSLVVVIL